MTTGTNCEGTLAFQGGSIHINSPRNDSAVNLKPITELATRNRTRTGSHVILDGAARGQDNLRQLTITVVIKLIRSVVGHPDIGRYGWPKDVMALAAFSSGNNCACVCIKNPEF